MMGHEDAHSSTVMLTVSAVGCGRRRCVWKEFLSHVPTELFSWCLEGASISQLRIVPAAYGALEETWSILEKVRIVFKASQDLAAHDRFPPACCRIRPRQLLRPPDRLTLFRRCAKSPCPPHHHFTTSHLAYFIFVYSGNLA